MFSQVVLVFLWTRNLLDVSGVTSIDRFRWSLTDVMLDSKIV